MRNKYVKYLILLNDLLEGKDMQFMTNPFQVLNWYFEIFVPKKNSVENSQEGSLLN